MKTIAPILAPLLTISGLLLAARPTFAQQYPNCQPPNNGEFLLLVVTRSQADQNKVRSALPGNANAVVCQYAQDVVVRVAGFPDQDTATSWADYMRNTVGLQAAVARPSQTASQPNPYPTSGNPVPYPTPVNPGVYNPQPLGSGFAVLVQYNNRPEIALQVRQFLNREIGLVSYGQRPYLLAVYTTDVNIADSILRSLSSQGYAATVVDSRQVVLLKPALNFSVGGY
jgi:hypothetical protein